MSYLPLSLTTFLTFSIIFNYLSFISKKTAIQIVNEMGIGYNLGNSFDCYDEFEYINTPDEQITLYDNPIPTKDMIVKIKKYGFKTIRFPVTWSYFIDQYGNINSIWMSRVKEVVDWIVKSKMYCILNLQHDGDEDNWLSYGIFVKDIYINIWRQISNEFKEYDNFLIFESMNKLKLFYFGFDYDYQTLNEFSQAFVDTVRNSGGNNVERLLIISQAYERLDLTSSDFKIPKDPSNNIAISIHYNEPFNFVSEKYFEPYNFTDMDGDIYYIKPLLKWGSYSNYMEVISHFDIMKKLFVDKGIPVIITQLGVFTEQKKEIESIREYLYVLFSISSEYNGIMTCLWDTSNKEKGDINYYDRKTNNWYDEKIKDNLYQISKGRNYKLSEYFIMSNLEISTETDNRGNIIMKLNGKKPLKIILNVKFTGILFRDIDFSIFCYDKEGWPIQIKFGKKDRKRQYDGTSTFTIDIEKLDCDDQIETEKLIGKNLITFNNLTIEYRESFQSFDYNSYKNSISNIIK